MDSLRIITLNTQRLYHGAPALAGVRQVLACRPQVLLLQEVSAAARQQLQQVLGTAYAAAYAPLRGTDDYSGTGVAYDSDAYEVVDIGHVAFPIAGRTHGFMGTTAVTLRHRSTGRQLRAASTHQLAQCGAAMRRRQFRTTMDFLQQGGDTTPTVLAGDFNTALPGEVARLGGMAGEYGMTHATGGIGGTCDWLRLECYPLNAVPRLAARVAHALGRPISLPLDHLLYNESFAQEYALQAVQVLRDITGSDHLPVRADFVSR